MGYASQRLLVPSPIVTALVAIAIFSTPKSPAATDLVNLGSPTFSIDPSATSIGATNYSQTMGTLDFSGTFAIGDTLGGTFASGDWSTYATFGLRMSLEDPNPELPFTVQFYDASFNVINSYQGTTSGLTLTPSVVMLTLSLTGTANFSSVVGMQFTWDGPGAINTSIAEVVGFPPPTEGFFVARAPGGVEFLTGTNKFAPFPTILATNATNWNPASFATMIAPGAASWAMLSDSNAKTDVTTIDHRDILRRVAELPVDSWRYKHDSWRRYVGPMAQDFHEAFGLGSDAKHISTSDTDGVALSALKGLIEGLQERRERSAEQHTRLIELEAELSRLQDVIGGQLPPNTDPR